MNPAENFRTILFPFINRVLKRYIQWDFELTNTHCDQLHQQLINNNIVQFIKVLRDATREEPSMAALAMTNDLYDRLDKNDTFANIVADERYYAIDDGRRLDLRDALHLSRMVWLNYYGYEQKPN